MQEENYEPEGMESEISEDAFEQDPVLSKYQTAAEQEQWLAEIEASRKERKRFDKRGRDTIKRYADERGDNESGRSNFNIFFANTEIKMSALFARIPAPDIKRRFDDADDDVSRVAATLLQRNLQYELECNGFEAKFKQVLFDRLVPGFGVMWSRFERETQPGQMTMDPMTGAPVQGPEVVTHECSELDYVAWDDFLWAPCRVWTECRWVGRQVPMSKAAVNERFKDTCPPEILKNLSYALVKNDKTTDKDMLKPKNIIEATANVIEVWDKERGLVFWITDGADVPLDVQKDTNEFEGFFPTPLPPLCRFTTSNTVPISDFSLVQDQYNELDDLNDRASRLIKGLQLRWVYDSQNTGLKDLFQNGAENQGIPIKDWSNLQSEKGGLKGSMEFAPLDMIAGTYQRLIDAREQVKNQIYEVEGIADAMRGVTDRYTTATATNAAGQMGASRITELQHKVADYMARLLRHKAHLICKFYSPDTILKQAGTCPEYDKQFIGPALQLLKSEQMMHFRLNVSVDSIQSADWNNDKQETTEFIGMVGQFLQQAIPLAQQMPSMAPALVALLKVGAAKLKGSKDFEGALDQMALGMQQAAAQKQRTPPKPTPDEMKAQAEQGHIQAEVSIAQMQEETKRQIAQANAQRDQALLELKAAKQQLDEKKFVAEQEHRVMETHVDIVDKSHGHAHDLTQIGGV